jgi:hypothetical protein
MTLSPQAQVHPSSVIQTGAVIGAGCVIGPFSVIGPEVTLHPGVTVKVEPLADADWLAMALSGLPPVRAGRFFIHGVHDRGRAPVNSVNLRIEAGAGHGACIGPLDWDRGQKFARGLGLFQPAAVEGDVDLPLEAPLAVPVGFAVAHQQEPGTSGAAGQGGVKVGGAV